jgi:hypothetical protein
MKFSIETTVAGAIAVAFAVLSMGVIAGQRGTELTSSAALRQVSARALNNSSSESHVEGSENQLLANY